jgi:predicted polyphosphate/ATP-dependent NAD kinase
MSTQFSPAKTDMRRHQRILVPNGRVIRVAGSAEGGRANLQGVVTVIGLGGMFFRTGSSQLSGTVLHLQLTDTLVTLESECTVRSVASNGLGVEFTGITHENEQKLKTLLSAIKL